MKKIPKNLCIAVNGPPGIGKDTLENKFEELATVPLHKGTLADLLRGWAEDHYKYPGFAKLATDQSTKDKIDERLRKTPRNALISYSEHVCKAEHGQDYIAKMFAKSMAGHKHAIMTDLGFDVETQELSKVFDLVITVQLKHPDFNFDNDSRKYIEQQATNNPVLEFQYMRDGDVEREVGILEEQINFVLGLAIDAGISEDH